MIPFKSELSMNEKKTQKNKPVLFTLNKFHSSKVASADSIGALEIDGLPGQRCLSDRPAGSLLQGYSVLYLQ